MSVVEMANIVEDEDGDRRLHHNPWRAAHVQPVICLRHYSFVLSQLICSTFHV